MGYDTELSGQAVLNRMLGSAYDTELSMQVVLNRMLGTAYDTELSPQAVLNRMFGTAYDTELSAQAALNRMFGTAYDIELSSQAALNRLLLRGSLFGYRAAVLATDPVGYWRLGDLWGEPLTTAAGGLIHAFDADTQAYIGPGTIDAAGNYTIAGLTGTHVKYYIDAGAIQCYVGEFKRAPTDPLAANFALGYVFTVAGSTDSGRFYEPALVARNETGALDGSYTGYHRHAAGAIVGDGDLALTMNGVTNAVIVSLGLRSASVSVTGALTLYAWVNTSVATRQTVFMRAGSSTFEYDLRINANGHAVEWEQWKLDGSNDAFTISAGSALSLNAWHLVVVTVVEGVSAVVYVDGVPLATTVAWLAPSGADPLVSPGLGQFFTGDYVFTGSIDEPAIWSRALTADEIANLYRIGMGQ